MISVKYLFRILFSKGMRVKTILAILSICIGIAVTIGVFHTQNVLSTVISKALLDGAPPQISIYVKHKPDEATLNKISSFDNVKTMEVKRYYDTDFTVDKKNYHLKFIGVNFDDKKLNVIQKTGGLWPSSDTGIMLDDATAKALLLKVGGTISIQDKNLNIEGTGVIPGSPSVFLFNISYAYVSFDKFSTVTGTESGYLLEMALQDYSDHKEVTENVNYLRNLLSDYVIEDTDVNEIKGFVGEAQVQLLSILLLIAGILSFIIGSILVFQTIFNIILGRIKDFGVFQSFGYPRVVVNGQIVMMGAIIGLLSLGGGFIFGILIGNVLTSNFAKFLNVPVSFSINIQSILMGSFIGVVCSVIATAYPILFINRRTILESLNYYKKKAACLGISLGSLPIHIRYIVRKVVGKPMRGILLVLFLGLASSMFIASISFSNSLNKLTDKLFSQYYGFHYLLELEDYHTAAEVEDALTKTGKLNNIYVEEFANPLTISIQKKDSSWEKDVAIMGIPEKSRTWDLESFLLEGRMYKTENEVVIGERLARSSNLALNDSILIETPSRKLVSFTITGIVKAYENRGFYLYTVPNKVLFLENGYTDTKYNKFAVKLLANQAIDKQGIRKEIQTAVKPWDPNFILTSLEERKDQAERALFAMSALVFMLAVLISFGALFGLSTNINLGIWENEREIATQLALGIRRRRIIWNFIKEFVFQGVVAWIISIGIGYFIGDLLVMFFDTVLTPVDYYFAVPGLAWSLLVILLLTCISTLVTSSKLIGKLHIPTALKIQS